MSHAFASPYYPLLISGDYEAIVSTAIDHSYSASSSDDLPWIIGALSFLGRSSEATGLFQAFESDLDAVPKIASRFFLGVALCREGHFLESQEAFLKNIRDARSTSSLFARFFCYQGLAFYRYATGRLDRATACVEVAIRAASGSSFTYGSALAFELLGHIQLSGGHFHAGFRHLDLAKDKAIQLGQGALYQAIEISIILYRATYGTVRNSANLLIDLNSFIGNEQYPDSYTQAALNLELARVYILRGELLCAKEQLATTSRLVYEMNNPELEMDYNLQLAHLLRNQGEVHQALSIVRGAKHRAKTGHDLRSRLKVLGFEYQLLKTLGLFPEQEALIPELTRLSQRCGTLMAKRYLRRNLAEASFDVRPGEDVLGDLIDRVDRFEVGVITDIIRGEWFGLLLTPLNVLPSECVLYLDAEPGSLTIFHCGDVRHIKEGCSTLVRKLLILLSQHPCSKETLANKLWRQAYNPLRHDGLIYPLIAKARKILGRAGDWILVYEFGYRLREGVRVAFAEEFDDTIYEGVSCATEPRFKPASELTTGPLNTRQSIILEFMKNSETVEPGALVKKLGVSDATITRDMATLLALGLAKRMGRGRATKYCLNSPPNEG